jgi:DNA polymerase-3 subunit gamma/tau
LELHENDFLLVWKEYCQKIEKDGKFNLVSHLSMSIPILKNTTIHLEYPNHTIKIEVERVQYDILSYMKEKLQNYDIDLEIVVNETAEKKYAYTPLEKYEKLIEKNPLIKNRSMVPQIRPKKLEIISTNSLSQNVIAELGKFDNDAVATVQLQNIKKVYSNLLLDKDLLIEEENDGSNIIYILRVESFENINDVENFCFEIRKQGTVCTPVFK